MLAAMGRQTSGVVVIGSGGAWVNDLLTVCEVAPARGAAAVALTESHSPPGRKPDAALIADHAEGVAISLPTVSRILPLLVTRNPAGGAAIRIRPG